MCWATVVLKLFRYIGSTIVFGNLFQNGIVLGKKQERAGAFPIENSGFES